MRKWLILAGILSAVLGGLLYYGYSQARSLAAQWEPLARQQLISYLEQRFDASVEVGKLDFTLPALSPWQLWQKGLQGKILKVSGEDFRLRLRKRTDIPPLIVFQKLRFDVDLSTLYAETKVVKLVQIDGLRLTLPPKGERAPTKAANPSVASNPIPVRIEKIVADGAVLLLLTRNPKKVPLEFVMHKLTLESQGPGRPWLYSTQLNNPKPPGLVSARGQFGPWVTEDARQSYIDGEYTFTKADLSVFSGIGGTLASTGKFSGALDNIQAAGQCSVPDFRLMLSGNPLPLEAKFNAIVDGTDGDVYLRQVQAKLGRTPISAQGEVVHLEGRKGRSIRLNVKINQGNIEDILLLAMKGKNSFLDGSFDLQSKLDLPPGPQPVPQKLSLDGSFALSEANFTSTAVQDKIDMLSQKGQGRPQDPKIDNVPAQFKGNFVMKNGQIDFDPVSFSVPGAMVRLKGYYRSEGGTLDLRGQLRLEAKVSETFRGWKRFALKPVDPLFRKNGAGTFLRIAITGDTNNVKFGLDRDKKD